MQFKPVCSGVNCIFNISDFYLAKHIANLYSVSETWFVVKRGISPSVFWHGGSWTKSEILYCIVIEDKERWLTLLIWRTGSSLGLRSKKIKFCLMLPVVTCLDVGSSDATGTKNCDIQKRWESLRSISQSLLPEFQPLKSLFPGWMNGLTESLQWWLPGVDWEKGYMRRSRSHRNGILRIISKPCKVLCLISVATSTYVDSCSHLSTP